MKCYLTIYSDWHVSITDKSNTLLSIGKRNDKSFYSEFNCESREMIGNCERHKHFNDLQKTLKIRGEGRANVWKVLFFSPVEKMKPKLSMENVQMKVKKKTKEICYIKSAFKFAVISVFITFAYCTIFFTMEKKCIFFPFVACT